MAMAVMISMNQMCIRDRDYRYFPEPDIQPINFTDEDLMAIRDSLPKLPDERLKQYTEEYGLSVTDAKIIVNDVKLSDFFNACLLYTSQE